MNFELIHTGGGNSALYAYCKEKNIGIIITDGDLSAPEPNGEWEIAFYRGDYLSDPDELPVIEYLAADELGGFSIRAANTFLRLIQLTNEG